MMDEIREGERFRLICEGEMSVDFDQTFEHQSITDWTGTKIMSVATVTDLKVGNVSTVWVQALDREKVRERISGSSPNLDALLLQERLDDAERENQRLQKVIKSHIANYDRSKELWKKRHREDDLLDTAGLGLIARYMDNPPEPGCGCC